jgi:uncharacterized membrane-anchored protein YjiN (DUF445 family)
MLTGMGATFVATRMVPEPGFLTVLIQSGAEAGMVRAARRLVRRDGSLPPSARDADSHTGIIPTNKDRIGRTLGRFVENNFLTPEF